MTDWVTVIVTVDADETDEVSGLLWSAGVAGVEECESVDGRVELRAGCEASSVDPIRDSLQDRWPFVVESVEADAGLDDWREFAQAWRAGSRLVIVPAWLDDPEWLGASDLVLSIDPGHTFGSGSHETTRMCLAEVEQLVVEGSKVADIGCGSGVLAIAAVRLGAAFADAIDIDDLCVVETEANADRNGVGTSVRASTRTIEGLAPREFDLVLANIGAGTLISLASGLQSLLGVDGVLVVSGVLDDQADSVIEAFGAVGLELRRTLADGQWRTLRFA